LQSIPAKRNTIRKTLWKCTRYILLLCPFSLISLLSFSQDYCPPNIDFERGTFDEWNCYVGTTAAINGENEISLQNSFGPVFDRHTMYDIGNSNQTDYYGGFPVLCPNGSGHSIKLGNNSGGALAEGISYEFTIPANQNTYSLIYHYAVVFQDPNHLEFQQPRLVIEIENMTDKELISCSSFTFYAANGQLLPGFFISSVTTGDTVNVWCKDWSAVSINLNGKAGKRIRLFFKTADCTFRRHFGYAYIDVNSECSGEFTGATFCPDDTAVVVTGPYGYQDYRWFNNDFTRYLGSGQNIRFSPPPPVGTTIAVEVVPYNGYGCNDTLYAKLIDTLTVYANAGKDTVSCNGNPVPIGANAKPGIVYRWDPPFGLSNPNIANPRAGPTTTTAYVLKASSIGGGCATTDTVIVRASVVDSSIYVDGKEAFCITSGDSAVLTVLPEKTIQWYRDNTLITSGSQTRLRASQSGNYYAYLINNDGCKARTEEKTISIEVPREGIRYPVQYAVINYPQQLQARTFGTEVEWVPPEDLSNSEIVNPFFIGTGDITYTIEITTAGGCLTVDTQFVKTFKEVKIYVPTAFTPNNDGLNDYLKPIPAGIKELKYFRIYNRWGQLVFDIHSDARGWDGKVGGKDQSTQVFVWVAEGIGVNNVTYKSSGTTTLIR